MGVTHVRQDDRDGRINIYAKVGEEPKQFLGWLRCDQPGSVRTI